MTARAAPACWADPKCLDRFWSRVDRRGDDECWPWTGKLYAREYPRLMAHCVIYSGAVFAWMVHNHRFFPEGKKGCHSCDNPVCCNPRHIWPGTQAENMRDCIEKGRAAPIGSLIEAAARARKGKQHCPLGHPFSGRNLRISKRGWRVCRTCERLRMREHRTMAQVIAHEAAQDPAHSSPSCARAGTLPGTMPFGVATAARAGDFLDSNHASEVAEL